MSLGPAINPTRFLNGGVSTTRAPLPAPVHPMCARMAGFARQDFDPAKDEVAPERTPPMRPTTTQDEKCTITVSNHFTITPQRQIAEACATALLRTKRARDVAEVAAPVEANPWREWKIGNGQPAETIGVCRPILVKVVYPGNDTPVELDKRPAAHCIWSEKSAIVAWRFAQ